MKPIEQISFFKNFKPQEMKRVFSIARLKKFDKGDIVFHKSEIGKSFFIVKSGKIKIFTSVGTSKKKTFAFLEKGDSFGEMSLLGIKIRSASAQAIEPSELLVISKANFKKLLEKNADFTIKLLHTLVKRLNESDKEIENMLFHNILGRLADKIYTLCPKSKKQPLIVSMDQNELAQCIGTTRVPICRAINSLKKCGVIDYKRGSITILDFKRLKSIANI